MRNSSSLSSLFRIEGALFHSLPIRTPFRPLNSQDAHSGPGGDVLWGALFCNKYMNWALGKYAEHTGIVDVTQ